MILLEVVDAERSKDAAARDEYDLGVARRRSDSSQLPPPPFQRAESPAPTYASSRTDVTDNPDFVKHPAALAVRRSRSIWRIIGLSFVVYIFISAVIATPVYLVIRRRDDEARDRNRQSWSEALNLASPPPPGASPPDSFLLPTIVDGSAQCSKWNSLDDQSGVYGLSYNLPTSGTIFLSTNISDHSKNAVFTVIGQLHVSLDTELQDSALLNVTFVGARQGDSSAVSACVVRTNSGWGVAISVPDDGLNNERFFNLSLTLPSRPNALSDYTQLTGLATYLPAFSQSFGQLNAGFDTFILHGSLGSIHVEYLQARSVVVRTSAADITGSFNSTGLVDLKTVLAPVKANVSLYNCGDQGAPSYLGVNTGNSSIAVNCTLYGAPNQNGQFCPRFSSSLSTHGGALEAAFWHDVHLTSSSLYLRAYNSLAPANVFVDSRYEGTYDVQTSLADAGLDRNTQLVDPTGAGRPRTFVDSEHLSDHISGSVAWGNLPPSEASMSGPPEQGFVYVQSSMAPAILQLTDSPDPSLSSDLYQ